MISKQTVEEFTKAMADSFHRQSSGATNWNQKTDLQKELWRRAATEGFEAVGVKVEGRGESAPAEEFKF